MSAKAGTRGSPGHDRAICVVGGAGRVGLPLALSFAAEGFPVVACDINETALDAIRAGRMPFAERGAENLLRTALRERRLRLSSDVSSVAGAATVIVTICTSAETQTPPDRLPLRRLADDMLPYMSDDQLLVLRSTVAPGTTDWLDGYLRCNGRTPKVSFCPERIVQGHAIEEIQQLAQIVSGTSPEAERDAAALFGRISAEIVRLTPLEAEFAKLFCNAYRYIQFAAANQFHMIASAAGVNYSRVLSRMKQGYPRARDIPPAGFAAGPCLQSDTMQLAAFASDGFSLGEAAVDVNVSLVDFLVETIRNRYGDLRHLCVGLLGMAFKADSDDTRFSLSYRLKELLASRAKAVLTTDPHVTTDSSLLPVEDVMERSDVLILCVPHSAYRSLEAGNKPVLDVWGLPNLG